MSASALEAAGEMLAAYVVNNWCEGTPDEVAARVTADVREAEWNPDVRAAIDARLQLAWDVLRDIAYLDREEV